MSPQCKKPAGSSFDPFTAEPGAGKGSRSWFWAMTVQALCTCALLCFSAYAEGKPWERHAQFIVLMAIVATWSLALRTIRERLVELMRHWKMRTATDFPLSAIATSCSVQGIGGCPHLPLRQASGSGRHWIPVPLHHAQEEYIKACIWRLRVIAAGITLPFFVLPFVWTFISVGLACSVGPLAKEYWEGVALFMMVSAFIVAGYFHWAILPLFAPVRVSGAQRRGSLRRPARP